METAKNQVREAAKQPRQFYTLDELKEFISGKSKVKLLEFRDFRQTNGNSCEFVFEGGFYLPGFRPHNPLLDYGGPYLTADLYSIVREELPPDIFAHYSALWEKIISTLRNFYAFYSEVTEYPEFINRPYDKVAFVLAYNWESSLHDRKKIFTEWKYQPEYYTRDDGEFIRREILEPSDAIQTLVSYHIIYDLFVEFYKNGERCAEPSYRIKGIPHFAIPPILKFLGECLSQALPMPKSDN